MSTVSVFEKGENSHVCGKSELFPFEILQNAIHLMNFYGKLEKLRALAKCDWIVS